MSESLHIGGIPLEETLNASILGREKLGAAAPRRDKRLKHTLQAARCVRVRRFGDSPTSLLA